MYVLRIPPLLCLWGDLSRGGNALKDYDAIPLSSWSEKNPAGNQHQRLVAVPQTWQGAERGAKVYWLRLPRVANPQPFASLLTIVNPLSTSLGRVPQRSPESVCSR